MVGTELKNKFESVVIRILDDRKVIKDLKKLGLAGYAREAFEKSINRPQGMVILTGPTGSGKSTTLRKCFREWHKSRATGESTVR